ncbi:MAG: MlaD family protein [Candidatus Thiodiazotropha sp.]
MPSKVSPTLIGSFVLASLVLGLGVIFLFSGSKLSHEATRFIVYFEGDVKGLQVGSPVNFRGVKVGQVERMSITYSRDTQTFRIPVIIGIEDERVKVDGVMTDEVGKLDLKDLIQQGLRARLNLQSLVTGKLEIELDFQPNTPIRLVDTNEAYPEIPTVQSGMEKIATAIEQLPIERITRRLSEMLDNIDQLAEQGDFKRFIGAMIRIADRLDSVTEVLNQQAPQILENSSLTLKQAQQSLDEIRQTAVQTQSLISGMEKDLARAFDNWDKTLASGDRTFRQVGDVANSANLLLKEDSEVVQQMKAALQELGAAARSIRIMSEYLERHPEALIRGKQ